MEILAGIANKSTERLGRPANNLEAGRSQKKRTSQLSIQNQFSQPVRLPQKTSEFQKQPSVGIPKSLHHPSVESYRNPVLVETFADPGPFNPANPRS